MTKKRMPSKKAVRAYVAELAALMRLSDWTIEVEFSNDPDMEDGAFATMQDYPSAKRATMTLNPDLWRMDVVFQRQTLVHELIHAHLFALHDISYKMLECKGGLTKQARAAITYQVECSTDALADAMAPLLPMPSWG